MRAHAMRPLRRGCHRHDARSHLVCLTQSHQPHMGPHAEPPRLAAPSAHEPSDECVALSDANELSYICDDEVCTETHVFLCTEPPGDSAAESCVLQDGLFMNGRQVWACGSTQLGQ